MKKLTQLNWIFISLAGFILFALFFYLVTLSKQKIELDTPVYFFLIILIDLLATGFLAGAMKSVATYQSNTPKGNLYLAGPVVVFCIILYVGYQYRPQEKKQPLSLSVKIATPDDTNEITNGSVSIIVDLFQQTRNINEQGIAFFTGINNEYQGRMIDLSLHIPGYHLPQKQRYLLSDSSTHTNLSIQLIKNVEQTSFQGRLFSLPDKIGISGAEIRFVGTSKVAKTDSLGNFSATLPIKPGTELRIIVLKGNKEVYNSLRNIYQNDFLTLTEME
ncbi:hypothetical protein ADIARSV_4011 [Arcticibacter svalbardensis MN12-7]|uniref:Uncharacterized protein n=1 Tax=Arcticibacter svalbardensis MN12-7 TaxID=1150600 RepID=R9GMG4_9SPHI|nr:hypothetical protein [Arcticibacter svalbardensis]EOR92923.1 hypothetical protein ADIARSV_4011 [Arcticibacter svalbardensis MN12-7]